MNLYRIVTVKIGRNSKYFLNVRSRPTQTFTNKKELGKAITAIRNA